MSSDEEECVEEAVQDQEEAMAEDVKQEPEQSEPAKRKQIIINYSLLDWMSAIEAICVPN